MSSPPTPGILTPSQLTRLLSFYPATVDKAYKLNTRLKDPKKRSAALQDDSWRYDELPRILAARRADGREEKKKDEAAPWLEKAELERLVGWKITHGTHRPFLPSLIRQNSPELVQSTTHSAFSGILIPGPTQPSPNPIPYSQISTALTSLTKPLKGVGPATATLLLSVHDPESIPFFSDELYAWLVLQRPQAAAGAEMAKMKLKYDLIEYQRLYEAWVGFRDRFGLSGLTEVKAVEVEKVAFVIGCWNLLDEEERRLVGMGEGGQAVQDKDEEHNEALEEGSHDVPGTKGMRRGEGIAEKDSTEGTANASKSEDGPGKSTMAQNARNKKTVSLPRKQSEQVKRERQPVDDDPTKRRSKRLKK